MVLGWCNRNPGALLAEYCGPPRFHFFRRGIDAILSGRLCIPRFVIISSVVDHNR